MAAAPPPQTFPYDHLFKILVIGDAGVGKVSLNCKIWPISSIIFVHENLGSCGNTVESRSALPYPSLGRSFQVCVSFSTHGSHMH